MLEANGHRDYTESLHVWMRSDAIYFPEVRKNTLYFYSTNGAFLEVAESPCTDLKMIICIHELKPINHTPIYNYHNRCYRISIYVLGAIL